MNAPGSTIMATQSSTDGRSIHIISLTSTAIRNPAGAPHHFGWNLMPPSNRMISAFM